MADEHYQTKATYAAAALHELAIRMGWGATEVSDALADAVNAEAAAWNRNTSDILDAEDEALTWARAATLDKLVAECAAAVEREQRRAAKAAA